MSGPIFAQIFSGPGKNKGGGENKKRNRRQQSGMLAKIGLPGLAEKMDPLRDDAMMMERKKRQAEAREQYFRDKARLHVQERRSEDQLKRQLARKKREIENYYRVERLDKSDPRLEVARRKARRKFEEYEREVQRKHHRQWQKSFRELRNRREKQYRDITKQIRRESRRQRGLPDKMQGPWNI